MMRGTLGSGALALVVLGAAAGCGAAASEPARRLVDVRRQDLVIEVEVTGTLKALDSDNFSPPPVPQFWDYKIARMAPEGAAVKAGREVIAFDTSELEKRLRDHEAEVAALTEEIGKAQAEASLARLNDRLEAEQKEAEARKSELRAEKPSELTAEVKLRQAMMDRDLGKSEVGFQKAKQTSNRRREQADLRGLRDRLVRAQAYVDLMRSSVAQMSVKARRAGTVVYKQNWQGEKKKVGDQVYPGDSALEIALLERMGADGQVDEVDASKVRAGQRVGLRLEANPDVEHPGTVDKIAPLVRTESFMSRVKIAQLEVRLAKTDPMMRPGMRFRGRIEVDRFKNVLQVPIGAVRITPRGPELLRARGGETEAVAVKLGRRSRDAVEVLSGVAEGDRVAVETGAKSKPTGGPRAGGPS